MTSTAEQLVAGESALWQQCLTHPFVLATADDALPAGAFDRWLLADHEFVIQFRRFLAGLIPLAPTEPARDVLCGGITALTPELGLFRTQLAERGLSPDHYEPDTVCVGYTAYLLASLYDRLRGGLGRAVRRGEGLPGCVDRGAWTCSQLALPRVHRQLVGAHICILCGLIRRPARR